MCGTLLCYPHEVPSSTLLHVRQHGLEIGTSQLQPLEELTLPRLVGVAEQGIRISEHSTRDTICAHMQGRGEWQDVCQGEARGEAERTTRRSTAM